MRFSGMAWIGLGSMMLGFALQAGGAETTYTLRAERAPGALQKVQTEIETEGTLKLNASGKQLTQLPLTVKATLAYDERVLAPGPKAGLRCLRNYHEAKADIRVGKETQPNQLREETRLILLQSEGDVLTLLSPHDPLSREELELIDSPANSAVLGGILPPAAVKVGESWQPTNAALAQLLNIEVVLKNEAQATLKSVTGDEAKLELTGKVEGSVGGIATHLELKAKATFNRGVKQFSWFAMSLKENRSIGHAEPGYEVTSQVKVLLAPLATCDELADKVVASLPQDVHAGQTLLRFESENAGFRLFHDRRWRAMIERNDLVVFRFIDRGDLVAQCNVTRLSRQPEGKLLSSESFQDEVKQALDKHFEQIVDASSTTTSNGLHVLRVTAVGKVAELPIHWIYYHVTAPDGRCYSCVITLEQKLMERFGGADQSLIDTFELLAEPEPKVAESSGEEGAEKPAETKAEAAAPSAAKDLPSALKQPASERR